MATFTTTKNDNMWEVKDELGTTLDVFETRIAAREYIRDLKQAPVKVVHMEGNYGYRDVVAPKPTPTPVKPEPIVMVVDYRPIVQAVKVTVDKIVGIATRSKERANSKAGKIRAYFLEAKATNQTMDQVINYLMEVFGETKPRAKAYVKCFW